MSDRDQSLTHQSQEAALPGRLIDGARDFIAAARAERTREAYRKAWQGFTAWCDAHGRQSLPASAETIAAWMTDLAHASRSPATINSYLAAVAVAHRTAGHALDRKNPLIADTLKGIARASAKPQRQARPIIGADLQGIIRDMQPALTADARDAALLALGWAAALRRSELIGLDWQQLGTGTGFLQLDERGIVVTLVQSKTSQADAVTIVVPCPDMPAACAAISTWAARAKLKPGQPVFRSIDKGSRIAAERLIDRSVSRIIKARVQAYAEAAGKSKAEANALAERFSGHSLRAGYATAAGAADVPSYRIQQHTRHKTAEMVARYVRESDKWIKSGLKGVGF